MEQRQIQKRRAPVRRDPRDTDEWWNDPAYLTARRLTRRPDPKPDPTPERTD